MTMILNPNQSDQAGANELVVYTPSMGDSIPKDKVCLLSFEDAENLKIEYKWRIKDVLGVGETMMVVGQSGAGKSSLTNLLAFQLLTHGEKFLDTFEIDEQNRPERVLIVQAENTMAGINKHIRQIIKNRPNYAPAKKSIKFLSLGNSGRFTADLSEDDNAVLLLINAIKQFQPQIVIIDPLQCYHSQDENNSIAMRRFLDKLQKIVEIIVPDANLIITHHDGKITDKKSAGRGSSAITDWSANFIRIQKKDGKRDEICISFGKTRNAADNDCKYWFIRDGSILYPKTNSSVNNKYGIENLNEYELAIIEVLIKNNNLIKSKGDLVSLVCKYAENNNLKKTSPNPIRDEIYSAVNKKIIVENNGTGKSLSYSIAPNLFNHIIKNMNIPKI